MAANLAPNTAGRLRIAYLLTFILVIAGAVYLIFYHTWKTVPMKPTWISELPDIQTAYKTSDLILKGTAKLKYTEKRDDVPYTVYSLVNSESIRNDHLISSDQVEIRLLGGKIGSTLYQAEKQKLLNDGDPYLLFLVRAFPDSNQDAQKNVYRLAGGYQGAFALKKDSVQVEVIRFNADNLLEQELLGKDYKIYLSQFKN